MSTTPDAGSLSSDRLVPTSPLYNLWSGDEKEDQNGPEKRLELDFRAHIESAEARHELATAVIGFLKLEGLTEDVQRNSLCMTSNGAMLIMQPSKLVLTTSNTVPFHLAIPFVVNAVRRVVDIQWASFMNKNTAAPWDETLLALEYAVLKASFEMGHAFVFGPVDADHYFYFVYDDIDRGTKTPKTNSPKVMAADTLPTTQPATSTGPPVENDMQVNVTMYNPSHLPEDLTTLCVGDGDGRKTHHHTSEQGFQCCSMTDEPNYETIRSLVTLTGTVVSFEMDKELTSCPNRITALVDTCGPERFTVMVLADPQTTTSKAFDAGDWVGIGSELFPQYALQTRTMNEFGPGYIVVKHNYVSRRKPKKK